jgi:hypothetical protein
VGSPGTFKTFRQKCHHLIHHTFRHTVDEVGEFVPQKGLELIALAQTSPQHC